RYGEAEPLYTEALQLHREVLGPHHPNTLLVQLNGVGNLAALGRDEAAVRLLAAMEPQTLIWLGSELYSSEAPGVRTHLVASQATYQDVAINLAKSSSRNHRRSRSADKSPARRTHSFWIGLKPSAITGVHVAFAVPDHAAVDRFYAAAVGAGGRDNSKPGLRPNIHPYYDG